ncbi:formate C-acetyltransferase [Marispirochaeta sp.]|uniref:formate C-acetyltransferase n=1 Tax=Marispirochaeta sp. TaxID=2038653 RepID=UPI0029C604F2|nr:formate C-acetyltransferase [Marispirochaeta sp.]
MKSHTDSSAGILSNQEAWKGFTRGNWSREIDLRDFVQSNYEPYTGGADFLHGPTESTLDLWAKLKDLLAEENRRGGILDVDTETVSGITAFSPGYIDKSLEKIVGLQTDAALKRAVMPYGGIRMARKACEAYGHILSPEMEKIFIRYRTTHNDGVFSAYTDDMKAARKAGIITGLPDAYGRGRIIGDYRRVALYGADRLIQDKRAQHRSIRPAVMDEESIRLREEITLQVKSLEELVAMAKTYGYDIRRPARTAAEAVQWLYFGYLAAEKEQNGAAMSLGRVSSFLDIYIKRDLHDGKTTELEAQELIDQFVLKLRIVRFLRTPEYNELFSGDPTWVTECIGGMGLDGRTLVTATSFRMLQTLRNLEAAPEPNMTVLWSQDLPRPFKEFCAMVSEETSSIQYENDDLMRPYWGDDYGIACCVSAMRIGKQMQFFGARCNLAKALLYAINGGRDEISGAQVAPAFAPITSEVLDYDELQERFDAVLDWIAGLYMDTLNVIHYMHDRYSYESLQMALHDRDVYRTMACGIAGISVCADSLAAVKYAQVRPVRDERGIAVDFEIEGEYPAFGNNDERADEIAAELVQQFMSKLAQRRTYRNADPSLSILTITSNVVYGKKTGATPDGRKKGEPFAPGANPMHGRDSRGALASVSSVAKLPYDYARDGISYTFSIEPGTLGKAGEERVRNLISLLDGYFGLKGHHINVNVLNRSVLMDAMEHPELYPQLTIRVSGYAVNFVKLTREQQLDVINRTFHERL